MSETEKAMDKLAVIEEYQNAKAQLTHIERRLKRFYVACREIGASADREGCNPSEPYLHCGKLEVGFTRDRFSPADLLNESELLALLLERQTARERCAAARKTKEDLGITLG